MRPIVLSLVLLSGLGVLKPVDAQETINPRLIDVEVKLVQVKAAGDWAEVRTSEKVDYVKELLAETRATVTDRFEVSMLENGVALLQSGQQVELIQDSGDRRGRSAQRVQVGTLLEVSARGDDSTVLLELKFEKSWFDPQSEEQQSPNLNTVTAETTLRVPDGETVLMAGVGGSGESPQLALLVTAHIEAAPKTQPKPARAGRVMKIYSLQFADAAQIAATLKELLPSARVQLQANVRNNSLIVQGDAQAHENVEALLQKLDRGK